jgi:DNA-directed RNA polymerase specialized sigma24 family protein
MSSLSDHECGAPDTQAELDAARRGDRRAFNRLLAAHQDELYVFTRRALGDEQTATEVAQAAVIQAARNLKQSGDWKFHVWLLHCAARVCREHLQGSVTAHSVARTTRNPAPETGLPGALCSLRADLRLPIILVDVIGLDYADAGIALGTSREQVQRRVAEARWRLMPMGGTLG